MIATITITIRMIAMITTIMTIIIIITIVTIVMTMTIAIFHFCHHDFVPPLTVIVSQNCHCEISFAIVTET